MPRKAIDRPAPRIIEPSRPNMPRFYEWDSVSTPGRVHRTMVFNGDVKGCTCRAQKRGCWHQSESQRYEDLLREHQEETRMTEENTTTAVTVRTDRESSHDIIVQHQPRGLTMTTDKFDLMWRMAQTAATAGPGMLPDNIKTPEAAMAVMMAGAELGFEPFAALRQVFIVNGKTQIMSEGLYALMKDRDPSLEVEWHQRNTEGAEASLWRAGREVIRIRYDATDRDRAKQGMKMDWQNGRPAKNPDGSSKYFKVDDSPWWKFPTDMFSWAVLKRLQRFGAPELVSLAPQWRDEEEAPMVVEPRSRLSQAVVEGQVSIAAASEGTEPPELENNPDVPPEETAPPEEAVDTTVDIQPDGEAPAEAEAVDMPVDTDTPRWASWDAGQTQEQREKLHNRLVRLRTSLAANDYGQLARGIAKDFCGDEKHLEIAMLNAEETYEAINRTVVAEGGDPAMYWGE